MKCLGRVQNFKMSKKNNVQTLGSHFSYFDNKYMTFEGQTGLRDKTFSTNFWLWKCWKTIKTKIPWNSWSSNHVFLFLLRWLCLFIYSNNSKTFTKSQDISNCFHRNRWLHKEKNKKDLLLFNHWRILILFFPKNWLLNMWKIHNFSSRKKKKCK